MNYKQRIYANYRSSFKGETSRELLQFGAEKIRPILQPWVVSLDRRSPAVDLGCGAGELLQALSHLGFENLSGCDISSQQTEIVTGEFARVVECDLFDFLSIQIDDSLELITAFDVIEHLTREKTFELMTMVYKKLRPGGYFIAHLPNGLSPLVGHVFWEDITHEWCLTPQSAKTLCIMHGFQGFEAKEHLGAGESIKGRLRSVAWTIVRTVLQIVNVIETGTTGGEVWTRNFAFKAEKPLS